MIKAIKNIRKNKTKLNNTSQRIKISRELDNLKKL